MNIKQALKIYKQRIGQTSRVWDNELAKAFTILNENKICTNCRTKMVSGYDSILKRKSKYIWECPNKKKCSLSKSGIKLMVGGENYD